jgi:hypothetical protein
VLRRQRPELFRGQRQDTFGAETGQLFPKDPNIVRPLLRFAP